MQLDSDWNELISIVDYQRKTRTIDTIGQSGAPVYNSGFQIIHPGNGFQDLLITSGRYYVGGLLVETSPSSNLPIRSFPSNHRMMVDDTKMDGIPLGPDQWLQIFTKEDQEGIIAQITETGTNWVEVNSDLSSLSLDTHPNVKRLLLYSEQTDHPNAGSYQIGQEQTGQEDTGQEQTDLIYLDVWERHITTIEDPKLREVALGGTDTDTRSKIIAQVKILPGVGNTDCDEEISLWENLVKFPNGRLSTRLVVPDDPISPCELGESGGYLGLENRLYRVEIHDLGTDGTATFKWSRDNAAFAYAIDEFFEETGGVVYKIGLKENGKDSILIIKPQDWVEISGDHSDLDTENPGTLTQVQKIEGNILTLDADVSAHLDEPFVKIRRWDTSNQRPLAITDIVEDTPYQIEDGVEIEFSGTEFKTGDFWVFFARTLTGEIELLDREAPLGIKHHYSRLALVSKLVDGNVVITDCRKEFYPLTELSPGDDLRLHHKYLHGFGVVCGLKVKCGTDRKLVTIEKGVALDCEGNMIRVTTPVSYNLIEVAEKQGFLDSGNETGDNNIFCISIAKGQHNNPIFSLEPYNSQQFWDRVLEGTLLKDFYEECILSLFNFFRDQFPASLSDVAPVPFQQRRLTAFLNLLFQLVNPENGSYGFISGDGTSGNPDEDQLLREFYTELKERIASETFCAMYDEDDPFPEYLVDAGLSTIFGPVGKVHHRLRIDPSGRYAYTCGSNNMVYVYHLEEQEMIQSIAFPSSENIRLQDIVLIGEGSQLVAVGIVDNVDSSFAIARIESNGHLTWGSPRTIQNMRFVSLGVAQSTRLFAVARSVGLFDISGIATDDFNPDRDQVLGFNATGLLHVNTHPTGSFVVFAAANRSETETSFFDHVLVFNPTFNNRVNQIEVQGEDATNDITTFGQRIFITSNEPEANNRILGQYDPNEFNRIRQTTIGPNNSNRTKLAGYSDANRENGQGEEYILITLSDQFKVVRVAINRDLFEVDTSFRIPVQLFPLGIAVDNQRRRGFVLNSFANTLTSMDLSQAFQTNPAPDYTMEPPENLRLYRNEAIEAYRVLLNHFIQHLKDCFCDKYLINCPECGDDDKVYLACVEIRNGEIFHICNFTKRKYVKTFRTVEYWLSTVPVLPLIREAFSVFCCTVIDRELFRQRR